MTRCKIPVLVASLALVFMTGNGGKAQSVPPLAAAEPGYADLADLFAAAPVAARVRIASAIRIAPDPSPGRARFFIEADVQAVIRGASGLPPRIRFLADVMTDSRGRAPTLKKVVMLLAAHPVAGKPAELRLAAPDAMLVWSATREARVRALVASVAAPGAPPPVTGIASAFHVAGSILGEGETQIFLKTASRAPISLTVLSRPGEAKRWALALGEIVDEAAEPPARDTLAWYRLACTLPRELPAEATAELASADSEAARTDYRFVMASLGECVRVRR